MTAESHHGVVIIGAGPAGLAVAASLSKRSLPYVMLERTDRIASSWHQHYDRLHLHSDRDLSGLPHLPFPRSAPNYPPRRTVVAYLEGYAKHFDIEPRFHQQVVSARRDGSGWTVETTDHRYRTSNVVVASGINRVPVRPEWPGMDGFRGQILHSSEYRNGSPWRGKRVLVVGMGNSGGEIALDLHEHGARSALAVRSPLNVIPRRFMGISYLTMGILQRSWPAWLADAFNEPAARSVYGDLSPYGIRKAEEGPVTQIRKSGKVPFIDVGTIAHVKSGAIKVYPGIDRFTPDGVTFTDRRTESFDAVVLATGYRPGVAEWLRSDLEVLDDGAPRTSGRQAARGLYFCGFYVSPTGMLREIALEAQAIARAIEQTGVAA